MITQAFLHVRNAFTGISKDIWLLSLVSLINRTGTMVVAFLTLYLTQSLHYDIRSAGYVMSCYGIGSILGAYFGGYLTDKIGYFKVQWLSLTFTGIMLLLVMLIHDFWWMCCVMFLLSLIAESFRPANSVAIRVHSNDSTRTRSFSLMRVSVNLAITVALSVGGLLVALGWNWLFWVDSLTCFGATAILLIYFKDKHIPPQLQNSQEEKNEKNSTISAYRDRKYLFFIILTFIGATIFMQLVWTVPAYFKQTYGWSEAQIGFMSAFNGFVVMLVEMPLVYQIEGKRSHLWYVRLGIILYGLSYAMFLLPFIQGIIAATFYMFIISLGEIFVMPFSSTWSVQRSNDARQGQYLALYSMAYSVSNVVAPLLGTQVIAAFGFNALWLLLVILSLITLLGFGILEKQIA